MAEYLNLKLKDGIEPSALVKYGFVPKYDEDTGEIICYLRPESTFGLPIVREGEYLVQFETKLWQRFGSSAYLALVSNPSEERRGWR